MLKLYHANILFQDECIYYIYVFVYQKPSFSSALSMKAFAKQQRTGIILVNLGLL